MVDKPVTPNDVVAAARRYIGKRWQHQGRTDTVDCIGLVLRVINDLRLPPVHVRAYGRLPDGDALRMQAESYCGAPAPLALGTLAVLRFAVEPQYLAIIGNHPTGGFTLIHALMSARKVVEHRLDVTWKARILSTYRLPTVDYGGV
jgi:hypothetical protein